MWEAFAIGFMTATWVFTVVGTGYVIWRYVKKPWDVMRKDVVSLNELILQEAKAREELDQRMKAEFGLRRAMEITPEMEVRAEARQRARQAWTVPPGV